MSKIWVFGHFLGNWSLKVSNFLHDSRRQYRASFECGVIFGKNLNPGIKGIKCNNFGGFVHCFQNWSLKVSNFLHYDRKGDHLGII